MKPQDPVDPPQLPDRRWQELCAHIRYTDDVSFKLLAFVPLVSIAGMAMPLMQEPPTFAPFVILVSLFAAAITLSLWIWERRNIQNCKYLRDRAADLERDTFGPSLPGHFFRFSDPPGGRGKTEGERAVYGITTAAWLLFPFVVFASDAAAMRSAAGRIGALAYAVVASAIGYVGWRILWSAIDPTPKAEPIGDSLSR